MKKVMKGIGAGLFFLSAQAVAITSGGGSISTATGTVFKAAGVQAVSLRTNSNYTADAKIAITGTMTFSGDASSQQNHRIGLVFGNNTALAALPTAGTPTETGYSLYSAVTTTWAGTNENFSVSTNGVPIESNTLIPAAATGGIVNYAVNLTFPANFTNGVDAADHVYLYELGIDWDRDGTYDVVRNGSFAGYEDDRIRLGFTVSKGTTASSVAVTNTYTYTVSTGHVQISPVVPKKQSPVVFIIK
jgi:hypothetical protein